MPDPTPKLPRRPEPTPVNPNCWVLDLGGGVTDEVSCDQYERRRRQIHVAGRPYEHVGEDAHGRWTYRPA